MENVKGIKVWVVVGKFDYEGDWLEDSGKVFLNKEDGVKYGEGLVGRKYGDLDYDGVDYDSYSIKECEVV